MPWYRTGTVSISGTVVTGTGTNFAQNARVGDAFLGPNGQWYEVTNITSQTVLSILPAYTGTVSGSSSWALAPIQGYNKESADQLREITKNFGGTLGVLGNQTNAAGVRTAIQGAKSGVNSDITSLTALTTPLSVAQGGTGGNTQATARAGLGLGTSSTLNATTALTTSSPSGSLPDASVCRVAEAVWAARSNHGFYTGNDASTNIDTIPNGWCGLVTSASAGTMPPIPGSFFWLETQATYTGFSCIQRAVSYTSVNPLQAFRIRNAAGSSWGPWALIQTSQDVVSSNSDSTVGKLLNVGYMGIGSVISPTVTDMNSTAAQSGGIGWTTSGTTNVPAGYGSGSVFFSASASASEGFQLLSARNLNGRIAIRRRVSSTWGAWIEPYMPWNVVGTVSGTSTAVTGSIIERGNNVYGNYTRYADGTMICWGVHNSASMPITGALQGGFSSAISTFAFPMPFIAAPTLIPTARNLTAFGVITNYTGSGTTATQGGVQFTAVGTQATSSVRICDWIAIGRWAN